MCQNSKPVNITGLYKICHGDSYVDFSCLEMFLEKSKD